MTEGVRKRLLAQDTLGTVFAYASRIMTGRRNRLKTISGR
jgi:hypothetical protein